MFLALFPLAETLDVLAKPFKGISSNLWASRVVEERELVSPMEKVKSQHFNLPNIQIYPQQLNKSTSDS